MRLRHAVEEVAELISILYDVDENDAPALDEDEVETFSTSLKRLSRWVARQRKENEEDE